MARRLLLAAAAALLLAAPAAAKSVSQDVTLTMSDGVPIACTFWPPEGVEAIRVPGVMLFHGLGGKREDMTADAELLSAAGYAALACDARGHGQSGLRAFSQGRLRGGDFRLPRRPQYGGDGGGDRK